MQTPPERRRRPPPTTGNDPIQPPLAPKVFYRKRKFDWQKLLKSKIMWTTAISAVITVLGLIVHSGTVTDPKLLGALLLTLQILTALFRMFFTTGPITTPPITEPLTVTGTRNGDRRVVPPRPSPITGTTHSTSVVDDNNPPPAL